MRGSRAARATRWLGATAALFAMAGAASVLFVAIAAVMRAGTLDRLDAAIELAVHRFDSAPADVAMKAATLIGSNAVVLPVVALVALVALRLRRRAVAIVLAIDAVAVIAAYSALKVLFSRERPRLFDKIALPTDASFPSGHSMSALGIYGVVAAALIALYPRARAPALVAAALLVVAVGLSRIYLGVHWPSDVVAGWLGGVPPLVAGVYLIRRDGARYQPSGAGGFH
jgi:undecaprenyl-diphosphatase